MSTITRELAKLFRKITNSEIDADGNAHVVLSPADSLLINNARIALASLEAEPVCVIDQSNLDYLKSGSDADVWPASRTEMGDVLLYRAAPPAPVVSGEYGDAYQGAREDLAIWKRRALEAEKEVQRLSDINDYLVKEAQGETRMGEPVIREPAPVSVPAAMEIDDDFDSAFEHGKAVGWNACRAAMLQSDGTLTNEGTMQLSGNSEQIEPVSNSDELPLDYLQGHKDGLEWAAQLAEANHPQTGDWLYDDPIDLARAIRKGQDMPTVQGGNSPVIPDGWVMVPVEPTIAILDEFDSIIDYGAEDSKDAWSRLLAAAWIKSLPAAPRQEVNRG
ncbi:DUF551 domain-containing protein [Escherichia coli]|nr:DUF551 domain-containing protein [Escherichia coli]